jgi:hypothetical protein
MELEHHVPGLIHSPIAGDLQGQGYLVSQGKTKVIVVEHETGLEIPSIAGDIASVLGIGLVPLVIQAWRAFRARRGQRGGDNPEIEIRRLDGTGGISEEHVSDLVEIVLRGITSELRALTVRVEALEKAAIASRKHKTKSPKKEARQPDPASPDAKLAHLVRKPN